VSSTLHGGRGCESGGDDVDTHDGGAHEDVGGGDDDDGKDVGGSISSSALAACLSA
jgi:hypothetical protein